MISKIKNLNILPAAYRHLVCVYFSTEVEATIVSATLKGKRIIIKYKLYGFLDSYFYDISGFGDYVDEEFWHESEDTDVRYMIFEWDPQLSLGKYAALIKCSTSYDCYWWSDHFDEHSSRFLTK